MPQALSVIILVGFLLISASMQTASAASSTLLPAALTLARSRAAMLDYARLYPDLFSRQGPPQRVIALTFDDGPDLVYTPQILRVLAREHVHATFFVLGSHVRRYPGMVRRIRREGHALGNHTFDHANLVQIKPEQLAWEVMQTDRELRRLTGIHSDWFRPPYGNVNPSVLRQLGKMGYHTVNWSVDSEDWRSLSASRVKYNILHSVRPGAIILQHSAGGTKENLSGTVTALPAVIHTLRARGYRFVTIPELFATTVTHVAVKRMR